MYKKPYVGQILYSLNVGNAARNREQKLTEYVVSKVGTKYFTIRPPDCKSKYSEIKFNLSDYSQVTDYSPNHRIYLSQQDWINEKEEDEICKKIKDLFQYGRNVKKISLSDLRKIDCILCQYEN